MAASSVGAQMLIAARAPQRLKDGEELVCEK
jgi:hypothetical protein